MRSRLSQTLAVICAVIALGAFGVGAGVASAAQSPQVTAILTQCAGGPLGQHYPLSALQQALRAMTPSEQQYTDCYDVIQQAITQARNHTGGAGGGGGGSFLPTPVIVIIVLLVLGGVTVGAVAVRRKQSGSGGGDGDGEST